MPEAGLSKDHPPEDICQMHLSSWQFTWDKLWKFSKADRRVFTGLTEEPAVASPPDRGVSERADLSTGDVSGVRAPSSPPPPCAFPHKRQTVASKLGVTTWPALVTMAPKFSHRQERSLLLFSCLRRFPSESHSLLRGLMLPSAHGDGPFARLCAGRRREMDFPC